MKTLLYITCILIGSMAIHLSCKIEMEMGLSNDTPNRPPKADAGSDLIISAPSTSTVLSGSYSTDPDQNIEQYEWKKIAGPPSFIIKNPMAIQTLVTDLRTVSITLNCK